MWKFLAPTLVSAHTNRYVLKPWGLRGGKDASNSQLKFKLHGSSEWKSSKEAFGAISFGKFSNLQLETGDEMLFITPGGGGYGDPFERDPRLVLEDFVEEYVTAGEAAETYGVMIDPEKCRPAPGEPGRG
ncbi:MAG: hydantoinase B/oxoprolinase family protein [Chloroflexi bacterium]|nr:hydantoinase B/oxoprolinase family protein [Chloroflexota bacterium]